MCLSLRAFSLSLYRLFIHLCQIFHGLFSKTVMSILSRVIAFNAYPVERKKFELMVGNLSFVFLFLPSVDLLICVFVCVRFLSFSEKMRANEKKTHKSRKVDKKSFLFHFCIFMLILIYIKENVIKMTCICVFLFHIAFMIHFFAFFLSI